MNGKKRLIGLVAAALGAAMFAGACGTGPHGHGSTKSADSAPVGFSGLVPNGYGSNAPTPSGEPAPASNTTPDTTSDTPSGHGGTRIEKAERWQTLQGPDFTIAAPEGWAVLPSQGDAAGKLVAVAPAGQEEPMVHILALSPISELFAQQSYPPDSLAYSDPMAWATRILEADFAARSGQLSAEQVIKGYVQLLAQQGGRLVDLQASSNDRAEATVAYSPSGIEVEERVVIQMHYEINGAYTGLSMLQTGSQAPLWDSFSFSTGCEAPAGQLDQLLPTCAGILSSFQPSDAFLDNAIANYIQQQAQQVQAVGGTIDQIGQLQTESAALQQQTTFDVGVGWANVLGGQVDLRNPSNGDVYHVDDQFGSYCLDQDGYLIGGHDQFDLQDDCAQPLERFRPRG